MFDKFINNIIGMKDDLVDISIDLKKVKKEKNTLDFELAKAKVVFADLKQDIDSYKFETQPRIDEMNKTIEKIKKEMPDKKKTAKQSKNKEKS
jgi:hypothetical protein